MCSSLPGNEPVLATDLHVQATYRLTEALVAAENRASRRVAMLSEIVFETDASGVLVFLNDAWARALGYPVEQCLGKPLSGFVEGEDREELGRVMAAGPVGTGGGRPRIRIPRHFDSVGSDMRVRALYTHVNNVVGSSHCVARTFSDREIPF